MSYSYEAERPKLFTEEGQRMFIHLRDHTFRLLETAGAAMMSNMMASSSGDTWAMLACADRMVELGDIREITSEDTHGQNRVFVKGSGQ